MHWNFEKTDSTTSVEVITGTSDTLEGNVMIAEGIQGRGLRLDGFTTCLRRKAENTPIPGDEFTIECRVALGSYPWNWCPILTTESDEIRGYRLMIGPHGQVSLQGAIGDDWISCTSEQEVMPLRRWMYLAGVYRDDNCLQLYVNGKPVASTPIEGKIQYARHSECRIGMVAAPGKPSDIHRTWGTVAAYHGIDGIIDEIKVHDKALGPERIENAFKSFPALDADIAPRKFPSIEKHPGRFGAFYTKLKYYPGWDNLWPVEQDTDIVVCFERSPVKVIFWRGIRYAASWVSENENWMTDQSVEAWDHGADDQEGCFEHMQDRHCRFSHVRIIENTDARVVVHWRYAPVSAHDNTWRPDPKTGWECWVDEYYYIYPDATGIRRVSWKKGSLGNPRQFQETLALLHPGQKVSDLLEKEVALIADYDGNKTKMLFVDDPDRPPYGPFSWNNGKPFTIQQYNFKSENKPYICFEPGNSMHLRHNSLNSYDRARGCNHFPVGQARCDGRTTRMADRPSHATSFPISDPVIHEDNDRLYWCALYGMNSMDIDQLIALGRSWAHAPELSVTGTGLVSRGFDRSRKCYRLRNTKEKVRAIEFSLFGTENSPIVNPAFSIENWNAEGAQVFVNGEESRDVEIGIRHGLNGPRLIVFLWLEAETKIQVRIVPQE
ncbi:MAG: LamG-like jellyroll fold domain-containing protein [Planctomycetota bacterium]